MKLSVTNKLGFLRVRGGRILRVAHDHQIPTTTYNVSVDRARASQPGNIEGLMPFKPRDVGEKWATAKVGDVAVEIIAYKTQKLIGHAYLTGPALNLIRYASATPAPPHFFELGLGIRVDPTPPAQDFPPAKFVAAMMVVKYVSKADVAVATILVPNQETAMSCARGLAQAYSYSPHSMTDDSPAGPEATAHFMATIKLTKGKAMTTIHLQPPKDAGEYAAQPFFHELVQSSVDLVDFDFFGNVPADLVVENQPTKDQPS